MRLAYLLSLGWIIRTRKRADFDLRLLGFTSVSFMTNARLNAELHFYY